MVREFHNNESAYFADNIRQIEIEKIFPFLIGCFLILNC